MSTQSNAAAVAEVAAGKAGSGGGGGGGTTIKREFVSNRQGKDYVLYPGLLDAAHQQGLRSITTTVVQLPSDANGQMAVVHATVETERGTYTGIGDATPSNVNRMVANALLRIAETRSKARALRDAVNVTAALADDVEDEDAPPERPGHPPAPHAPHAPHAEQPDRGSHEPPHSGGTGTAVGSWPSRRTGAVGQAAPWPPVRPDRVSEAVWTRWVTLAQALRHAGLSVPAFSPDASDQDVIGVGQAQRRVLDDLVQRRNEARP